MQFSPSTRNTALFPSLSSIPKNGKNTVKTNMYDMTTHWTCDNDMFKSLAIGYNARFTELESSIPKKFPVMIKMHIVHLIFFVDII